MTTAAAMLAGLPMIFGHGTGLRQSGLPSRRGCCPPHPSQSRMCSFPASGRPSIRLQKKTPCRSSFFTKPFSQPRPSNDDIDASSGPQVQSTPRTPGPTGSGNAGADRCIVFGSLRRSAAGHSAGRWPTDQRSVDDDHRCRATGARRMMGGRSRCTPNC
jgi:hypothetical protein